MPELKPRLQDDAAEGAAESVICGKRSLVGPVLV
jgi:hypothetical protein